MSKFRENMEHEKERLEQTKEKLEEKKEKLEEKLEEKLHAERTRKVMNVITVIGLVLVVVGCIAGWKIGLFTNEEVLDGFLQKAGPWAPVVFVLIQIIQVIIPIIPGGVSLLAGVLIFGAWWGFVYNYVGIVIGSMIVFYLGRAYGRPWIRGMVPEKTYQKYIGWLDRGKAFDRLFAIAIFFPVAPDDFLCMVAGLSGMSFKKFSLIILLGKPLSIFLYSLALLIGAEWLQKLIGMAK